MDEVREKYETRLKRLMDQREKEEDELARDKSQLQGRVGEEILTGLDTVAGMFGLFGTRRRSSLSGVSRVASKQRMQARARVDVQESVDAIKRMEADLADLQDQMQAEMSATTDVWAKAANDRPAVAGRAQEKRRRRAPGHPGLDTEVGGQLPGRARPHTN